MTTNRAARLVLDLRNDARRLGLLREASPDALRALVDDGAGTAGLDYAVTDVPALAFRFTTAREPPPESRKPGVAPGAAAVAPWQRAVEAEIPWLTFGLGFDDADGARRFLERARARGGVRVGTDVALATFDSWCPDEAAPPFFHTRGLAHGLIRAEALRAASPPLEGQGVNVVVVDEGLPFASLERLFPNATFAGGWYAATLPPGLPFRWPGLSPPGGHGGRTARTILALAPRARLFDLPVIPPRMLDVMTYTAWLGAAFQTVRAHIRGGLRAMFPGPWVLCNAWGIYDLRLETIAGDYSQGTNHPLLFAIADVDADGHDLVFGAGNCGQFCPDPRCGPLNRGPGASIWGANAHPAVLTVGAVRADGLWLGYSSQGPGPAALAREKPDLCAPSHFVDPADARIVHGGTSAASAVAAGAVAALRSQGGLAGISPAALRDLLRSTARRPAGAGWNHRLGHGILDLSAALSQLGAPKTQAPGRRRWRDRLRRLLRGWRRARGAAP